jgi:hypothetical protein
MNKSAESWPTARRRRGTVNGVIDQVEGFLSASAARELSFWNEAELQHELGFWFRQNLPSGTQVYFERPVGSFCSSTAKLVKKEIDLVVVPAQSAGPIAIELKCPRNGQIPETMFSACRDLQFLEQLVDAGFAGGLFLMHVNSQGFYGPGIRRGIYAHFRGNKPLPATIRKPTGAKDQTVKLACNYTVTWRDYGTMGRYWLQRVNKRRAYPMSERT